VIDQIPPLRWRFGRNDEGGLLTGGGGYTVNPENDFRVTLVYLV